MVTRTLLHSTLTVLCAAVCVSGAGACNSRCTSATTACSINKTDNGILTVLMINVDSYITCRDISSNDICTRLRDICIRATAERGQAINIYQIAVSVRHCSDLQTRF